MASGTADTMECWPVDSQRRRDEDRADACHGCLVSGGHVNLSPADDILVSVERPLAIDTREQMDHVDNVEEACRRHDLC